MKVQTAVLLVAAVLAGAFFSARAQESGDALAGRGVARESCATCHGVLKGEQHSPSGAAPPFQAIAVVPGMTAMALRSALLSPHHTMPNIILSPRDLADVVAYILSLAR
jgi:mono/diheme cytochrome c family protein